MSVENIDWFNVISERLRDYSDGDIWSDGYEILCESESAANTIAELIERLYASQQEDVLVHTGYYEPLEDEQFGEVDKFTGWWYVDIY